MNKICKIHGASGAGKTTTVREVMAAALSMEVVERTKTQRPLVYELIYPDMPAIYVLGSYDANCGGVDNITDYQDVLNLLDRYHHRGHILFEGLLQSTYYGTMGVHSQLFGDKYIYAFLDTPIETCIERVQARRAANDTKTKFNPENTRKKWYTIQRLKEKLLRDKKHDVRSIGHSRPTGVQVLELLR